MGKRKRGKEISRIHERMNGGVYDKEKEQVEKGGMGRVRMEGEEG